MYFIYYAMTAIFLQIIIIDRLADYFPNSFFAKISSVLYFKKIWFGATFLLGGFFNLVFDAIFSADDFLVFRLIWLPSSYVIAVLLALGISRATGLNPEENSANSLKQADKQRDEFRCPKCNAVVLGNAVKCGQCGTSLKEAKKEFEESKAKEVEARKRSEERLRQIRARRGW